MGDWILWLAVAVNLVCALWHLHAYRDYVRLKKQYAGYMDMLKTVVWGNEGRERREDD